MNIITLTKENLEQEHICCAISNNNDCQVASKKAWLAQRFDEGLVFQKGDVRGKCFIEYIPAERAWAPVLADGYMYINCFWVSGQYKGQGNANLLLDACIRNSKEQGKLGLVTLSSTKKLPFLSDPKFLRYKGFLEADTAAPSYVLLYLPFAPDAPLPRFRDVVGQAPQDAGFVLYYSPQCPYTAKYVPIAAQIASENGVQLRTVCFSSAEEAQRSPAPFTAYSLFHDGSFVTHEILSEKKLAQLFANTK